jgi:hypothetical protein
MLQGDNQTFNPLPCHLIKLYSDAINFSITAMYNRPGSSHLSDLP